MATTQITPEASALASAGSFHNGGANGAVTSLTHGTTSGSRPEIVPSGDGLTDMERHPAWPGLSRLPVYLEAAIPLVSFRVGDLMALATDSVVVSAWPGTADIPLRAGAVQLSWAEFEVVEGRMAVRLTLLA